MRQLKFRTIRKKIFTGYRWVQENDAPKFCPEHGVELEQIADGSMFDEKTGQKIGFFRLNCPYRIDDYDMHGCYDYHDTRGFFTFTCNRCGKKERNRGEYV